MKSPEAPLRFGGHDFIMHADGVLYWPSARTIIASDLHFEKASYLASHGNPIPPYDTHDTLLRLEKLIAHFAPQRLILLGDSFHDARAWERLDVNLRARIVALAASVAECIWVEGNHDALLGAHPLGIFVEDHVLHGIGFSHHERPGMGTRIIGHYHPKVRVPLGLRHAHGKCFVYSTELLVMPAFGTFTGGLSISHPTLQALFDTPIRAHLLYRGGVYAIARSDKVSG